MKRLTAAGLFLFMFMFIGGLALHAQNLPSINIVNDTGYTFYFLYVSSSESDDWGDDILEGSTLEDGGSITYQLADPLSSVNEYDIKAEDEDEDTYYKWDLTVTNNARIVFTLDDLD